MCHLRPAHAGRFFKTNVTHVTLSPDGRCTGSALLCFKYVYIIPIQQLVDKSDTILVDYSHIGNPRRHSGNIIKSYNGC